MPDAPPHAPVIGRFSNSYALLDAAFYANVLPTPVSAPRLVKFNQPLADKLGLQVLAADMADIFSGNLLPAGAAPLAMAYAGHQFGGFAPQLGDGRAILLAELLTPEGKRFDLQLKGAGPTPFSRQGDGRAALGPVLREYIISEFMHALGLPTTRALAAVATGESILREGLQPGGVLTRIAASHIRVGTFQYFAARRNLQALRQLADYVIIRHYPECRAHINPHLALLQAIATAQASLLARWMHAGFIHGVMNTDNMTVSGQTIDYGPCAFMDEYDPATVYSFIDNYGRYAYANQPGMANWNLARLAEAMLPLLDADQQTAIKLATPVIENFQAQYQSFWLAGARAKLGLSNAETADEQLMLELLELMRENAVDYTNLFRHLADAAHGSGDDARAAFTNQTGFNNWQASWHNRLSRDPQPPKTRIEAMQRTNPAFIARNHLVEHALKAATTANDYAPFETLLIVLANPFADQPEHAAYKQPPTPGQRVQYTFCGT